MACIHSADLAAVITSFIGVFVIHVVGYPSLGEYQWVVPHVPKALVSQKFKLIAQAVSDCRLSYFYAESWREVFPTEDAYHIHVIETIPVRVKTTRLLKRGDTTDQCFDMSVRPS